MSEPEQQNDQRIELAIGELGREHEPPVGWEARVLAASTPKRRRWWMFAIPMFAVAALIVIVVGMRGPTRVPPLKLAIEIAKSGSVTRGDTARPGDVVRARVTGGSNQRALWVYRNDRQLVLVCPGQACRLEDSALVGEVKLPVVGSYTVVGLHAGQGQAADAHRLARRRSQRRDPRRRDPPPVHGRSALSTATASPPG
ncbi:MAG: hypothetical protein WKG01_01625 [Kofleriaceae bacterium]